MYFKLHAPASKTRSKHRSTWARLTCQKHDRSGERSREFSKAELAAEIPTPTPHSFRLQVRVTEAQPRQPTAVIALPGVSISGGEWTDGLFTSAGGIIITARSSPIDQYQTWTRGQCHGTTGSHLMRKMITRPLPPSCRWGGLVPPEETSPASMNRRRNHNITVLIQFRNEWVNATLISVAS